MLRHPAQQDGLAFSFPGSCRDHRLPDGLRKGRHVAGLNRDINDDQGIRVISRKQRLDRSAVLLGPGRRNQIDRVRDARGQREELSKKIPRGPREVGHDQSAVFTGIRAQNGGTAGVRDNGHPASGRKRLVAERACEREQLIERIGPDDSGLAKHCLDADIAGGQRGRMRARRPGPSACPTAFHRDDRFQSAHPPGDPSKAPWVAEGFEVEKNDVGGRVFFPILQEIVAGHVGFVSHADEGREAQLKPAGFSEDGEPQGAALR